MALKNIKRCSTLLIKEMLDEITPPPCRTLRPGAGGLSSCRLPLTAPCAASRRGGEAKLTSSNFSKGLPPQTWQKSGEGHAIRDPAGCLQAWALWPGDRLLTN